MVQNLQLLFEPVPTTTINRYGSLKDWINEAYDKKYWTALVQCLLYSDTPLPEQPTAWAPPPHRSTRVPLPPAPPPTDRDHEDLDTAQPATPPRQCPHPRQSQQSQPPVQPSTTPPVFDPKQWLNDPVLADKVGQIMSHVLKLLGLGLGASEMEVKIRYRQLAREYHPDKNNQEVTGLTTTEASDFFKLLNNANMFLRGQM
jgi:hypothetical protein